MFTYLPSSARTIILTDTRSKADAETDLETPRKPGTQTVLQFWQYGRETWGRRWSKVARAALFESGAPVTKDMRAQTRQELQELLVSHPWERIVVLQSLSKAARKVYKEDEAPTEHTGSLMWDFFSPPGPLSECAGTFLETRYGLVMPIINPRNYDYVWARPVMDWLAWIRDGVRPLSITSAYIYPDASMEQRLREYLDLAKSGSSLSLDIENFTGSNLITTLGFSDGDTAAAIPWHTFRPHGQDYLEPGFDTSPIGDIAREILKHCPLLVGHNLLDHDIPLLRATGCEIRGQMFDTYLASGVSGNQLRHGLQQCCSYVFPVSPWKTLYRHGQRHRTGMTENVPEFWLQYPEETRRYNCQDSWQNARLGEIEYQRIYGKAMP